MPKNQRPWRFASWLMFVLMAYAFCPTVDVWRQTWEERSNLKPDDRIPIENARVEVKKIRRQITDAGTGYTASSAYEHKKRLIFLERRLQSEEAREVHDQIILALKSQADALSIFRPPNLPSPPTNVASYDQNAVLAQLMKSSEYVEIIRWSPTVFIFHHEPIFNYWLGMWWRIMLIAACYYVFVMIDRGLSLTYVALMPVPFLLACAFPPIGILVYPTRDPAKQLASALKSLAYFIALALSCGATATVKAQTGPKKTKESGDNELSVVPGTHSNTLTMWVFGDVTGTASHDRQVIFQFTAGNGFTVIQQNRQTSDRTSAGGNVSAGWKFAGKRFDTTVTVGPAFDYKNGRFAHQLQMFVISSWKTRYFQFGSVIKLFFPTDPDKSSFGDRHIQTIRGPTNAPRWLKPFALQMENWHVSGPGGGHWNEFMVGPSINLGLAFGKKRLSDFSVYPFLDFCRPQPGHRRTWDVRVQWKHDFAF